MKSSIKVELGPGNRPVIRMKIYPTDDVRDVLFQQFKEGFEYTSNLCHVDMGGITNSDGLSAVLTISPIGGTILSTRDNLQQLCTEQLITLFEQTRDILHIRNAAIPPSMLSKANAPL